MNELYRLKEGETRSISPENLTGAKGAGGMAETGIAIRSSLNGGLGKGWKVNPCIRMTPGQTVTIADIKDSGVINHIWMTLNYKFNRSLILRMYWDESEDPSVQVPIGDFFCNGYKEINLVNSANITVAPANGLNSYFPMPFRKGAKITVENVSDKTFLFFYQISYTLKEVEEDARYFHASFKRFNPTKLKEPTPLLDKVKGEGHFVGMYLAWKTNNRKWWGEGEIKFYIDKDEYPTICGTGTEDYFGGAWNFEYPKGRHCDYTSPYLGFSQANRRRKFTRLGHFWHKNISKRGIYWKGARFNMYRWHNLDPIIFKEDFKIEVMDMGIGYSTKEIRKKNQDAGAYDDLKGWRIIAKYIGYRAQQSDIAATSYWYQTMPSQALPDVKKEDMV